VFYEERMKLRSPNLAAIAAIPVIALFGATMHCGPGDDDRPRLESGECSGLADPCGGFGRGISSGSAGGASGSGAAGSGTAGDAAPGDTTGAGSTPDAGGSPFPSTGGSPFPSSDAGLPIDPIDPFDTGGTFFPPFGDAAP